MGSTSRKTSLKGAIGLDLPPQDAIVVANEGLAWDPRTFQKCSNPGGDDCILGGAGSRSKRFFESIMPPMSHDSIWSARLSIVSCWAQVFGLKTPVNGEE